MPRAVEAQFRLADSLFGHIFVFPDKVLHVRKSAALKIRILLCVGWDLHQDFLEICSR